jgi:hypothetical protein
VPNFPKHRKKKKLTNYCWKSYASRILGKRGRGEGRRNLPLYDSPQLTRMESIVDEFRSLHNCGIKQKAGVEIEGGKEEEDERETLFVWVSFVRTQKGGNGRAANWA